MGNLRIATENERSHTDRHRPNLRPSRAGGQSRGRGSARLLGRNRPQPRRNRAGTTIVGAVPRKIRSGQTTVAIVGASLTVVRSPTSARIAQSPLTSALHER